MQCGAGLIAVLLAILSVTVLGLPLARLFAPRSRPLALLGFSFLFGSGAVYFALLALSVAGIRWSLTPAVITLLIVSGSAFLVSWRRSPSVVRPTSVARPNSVARPLRPRPGGGPESPEPTSTSDDRDSDLREVAATSSVAQPDHLHLAIDAVTLLTLLGYVFYATLASLWEWDFWAIWGLKARVFFERRAIDWPWLENPFNSFAHPDYPLLLPLNFDFAALATGMWDDRWLGLICVGWAAAITLIVHDLVREELPPIFASIATLVAASIACSRFVGMAEGPLIAFGGGALLMIRRGLREDDDQSIRNGAILLGLAACCKNEGLALLAAAVMAFALVSYRRVWRSLQLWPALVIAAPWLLLRATHRLPTDLATGSVLGRFQARLGALPDIGRWLGASLPNAWFWIAVVISWIVLLIFGRRTMTTARDRGEADRFVVLATAIQLSFYLASYLVTPNDVQWHISTSWSRLISQIAIPITVVTVIRLSNLITADRPRPSGRAARV